MFWGLSGRPCPCLSSTLPPSYIADPESQFSLVAGYSLNYVLLNCCILKFMSWLRQGWEWSEKGKIFFEGRPWLNLSSSIKKKEICIQDEATKPEQKGKVLWRDCERTTLPVVYKEWLPIQSTSWHHEMSLRPTSWWTEQDGLIEEAFHWRFAYSFRGIGHEHHDSRHETERYTKWHTAHRESQTETDMGFWSFRDSVPPTKPHILQINPPLLQQGYTSSIQGHSS